MTIASQSGIFSPLQTTISLESDILLSISEMVIVSDVESSALLYIFGIVYALGCNLRVFLC